MNLEFKKSIASDPSTWPNEGDELKILFLQTSSCFDSVQFCEAIVIKKDFHEEFENEPTEFCIIKTDIGFGDEIDASEVDFLYMSSNDFLKEACKELGQTFNENDWKQSYGAMKDVVLTKNT